ncbi:MAG: flagellar protein FlgN [Gammaproteobacteria bacterium]|nr:flagellar protein FlgN [Gammaproteobacteria bacterium]
MMATPEDQKQLGNLLRQESDAAAALLAGLRQEHAALRTSNAAAIEHIAADKQRWVNELETLAGQHAQILRNAGYPPSQAGLERYITEQDPHGIHGLDALWQALKTVSMESRRQNQINGGIIALGRMSIQRTLAILRGQSSEQQNYYSASGTCQADTSSQSLGQA